ncbi:sulfite exporter TauE/SafE family protein [Bacillus salitolerans]|uniref:Probable membrane transporter protein n=1 Tax=Bacillus salitolerans TaxID=1437434 RepID=A0ABW4LRV5_9BACI
MDSTFFLLFFIGLFSSFLGTLAGGGGIITLPAMMLVGIPIQVGIATNKFSSGIASFTSILYLIKNKLFSIRVMIQVIIIAFFGGTVGAILTSSVSEQTMNIVALILLVFALLITLKNKQLMNTVTNTNQVSSSWSRVAPFMIAVYDGGFGPGSSTFAIIHYLREKFAYVESAQLARVLNFGSCVGAFIIFYQTGYVQWEYAIALAIGSAIGTQIGLRALPRIPLKVARTLLLTIICLLIGQVVYKTF